MEDQRDIRRAHSCATNAREAAREFHAGVVQPETELVLFFCSSGYDLEALGDELRCLFGGVQVVGCTTAGEIGPAGYRERSLSGASLGAGSFTAASGLFDRLERFGLSRGQTFVQETLQELERKAPQANADNTFAFLLIDGLSVREEPVTRAFQHALGSVPLLGGSAGDGLEFSSTRVYHDGRFHSNSAVMTLVSTPLAFVPFMTQHFVASRQRVVVTAADTARRVVQEIDGRPAAATYAELVGVRLDDLDPMRFAASPMVVVIGGQTYVRSISKARPDGSLEFFCAIDEGMVLRVAQGVNLMENLEQAFTSIRGAVGDPALVLGCDCILRRLEIAQRRLVSRVEDVMRENRVVGFSSYGEQYRGVHVNQTLTGIAIGRRIARAQGV